MKVIKDKETIETMRMASRAIERVYSALKTTNNYYDMESDIDFIFDCVSDRRKAIWEGSVDGLLKLANISHDIREKIINVMETGKAHEKFAITCSTVYPKTVSDKEFAHKILNLALTDKNKKVKIFGAYRANGSNFYDLAQTIKEEADKAVDKQLKGLLETVYIYLTKGYIISEDQEMVYISFSSYKIPENIPQEKIHEYVVTRFNYGRIKDLYGSM